MSPLGLLRRMRRASAQITAYVYVAARKVMGIFEEVLLAIHIGSRLYLLLLIFCAVRRAMLRRQSKLDELEQL